MLPADSYREALNSHRHYDTMANMALSLMVATMAGTPVFYGAISKILGAELVFLLGVVIIHFTIQTYKRFDSYAAIALNVAAAIESDDQRFRSPALGFATVFKDIQRFPTLAPNGVSRTYRRIRSVGYGASALFLLGALLVFVKGFS
ncbi:hypothetical protein [Pseudomonas syringae group genomosp. 3]|uniref:hypothetical protein n=1 Tax=Pseudomonas syringae group genomosp. 3 TaxID=251701 RepID=UPI000F008BD3|nr:hypothetical protein [Pseudomonas syringae group genomosp. 3]